MGAFNMSFIRMDEMYLFYEMLKLVTYYIMQTNVNER